MPIDEKEVIRIAALAGLELGDDDVRRLAAELDSILTHVESLDALPIGTNDGVDPGHASPAREDRVTPSLGTERAVDPAPDTVEGYFRVPPVLDE